MSASVVPHPRVADLRLVEARGHLVVLDTDLATLYAVETKAFNQAIKRNRERFPDDFAFQLAADEWAALRSQFVTLDPPGRGRYRKYLPWVFTEHGAVMASSVLNSPRAVAMSVYVVRVFVRMRRELLAQSTLEARLAHIEKTLLTHDAALRELYAQIKPLLLPPPQKPRPSIGFRPDPDRTGDTTS